MNIKTININKNTMSDITIKIQKLLSLSKSCNEEEANSAFAKAKSLAMKYNLDLELAAIEGESVEKEPFSENEIFKGRLPVINKYIINIVEDFFNVKVVYSTYSGKTRINFIGRINE